MCLFHKWSKPILISGVAGRDCDWSKDCLKCGKWKTWPSGQTKPWTISDHENEFMKNYKKVFGDIVNFN